MSASEPLGLIAILSALAALGGAGLLLFRTTVLRRATPGAPAAGASPITGAAGVSGHAQVPKPSAESIPWNDMLMDHLNTAIHARAFDAPNFQYYPLSQEHAAVLDAVRRKLPDAASRREYFPRKPHVLPRLMAAIRNDDSTLKELVEIIMSDPVLTGDVLRVANSPFYRGSREPVESIGRAVVTLGTEGLRSLVAGSVMQPVFQVPRGYFESFSPTIWRQAQCAALAAQLYARATRECDSFAAHLLALLFYMSHIVLFRMTVAAYVEARGSLPRADLFASLIDQNAETLARDIVHAWELPEPMVAALEEHAGRRAVNDMTPLARALYIGRICGSAAALTGDCPFDDATMVALLESEGLPGDQAGLIWASIGDYAESC